MKAVILAAGIASRLRPLTDNTPKCLLTVGGKTILELTVGNLLACNIKDIIIVTGYLENRIREFMGKTFPPVNVSYIHNPLFISTNNIYSLWLTREAVSGSDMLMMDSDIVFEKEIISKLTRSGYENCLALKRHELHEEEIKVKTDSSGRVLDIGKEVNPAEAEGESIGIEIFGRNTLPGLFSILDHKITVEKKSGQFYEAAFLELVKTGTDIHAVDCSEYFCMEIDTAEDLKSAELYMNSKK